MSTLLLVRHAQSQANADGVLAGRLPGYRLSDTGRKQAEGLAQRLQQVPLCAVYTSPITRCQETAQTVASPHELVPIVAEQLTECDYGDWSGGALKELAERKEWQTVQRVPSAATFPGGENLKAMSDRAVATINYLRQEVMAEHGDKSVWAVCSHGDVIKSVVAHYLGLHFDLFQRLAISTASVSVVTWHGNTPSLRLFNDTGDNYPNQQAGGDEPAAPAVGGETR